MCVCVCVGGPDLTCYRVPLCACGLLCGLSNTGQSEPDHLPPPLPAVQHLVEQYSHKFVDIDYVETFKLLKVKYDQIMEHDKDKEDRGGEQRGDRGGAAGYPDTTGAGTSHVGDAAGAWVAGCLGGGMPGWRDAWVPGWQARGDAAHRVAVARACLCAAMMATWQECVCM